MRRALILSSLLGLLASGCASVGIRTIGHQPITVIIGQPTPTPTPNPSVSSDCFRFGNGSVACDHVTAPPNFSCEIVKGALSCPKVLSTQEGAK